MAYSKYDWAHIGKHVIKDYVAARLSNIALLEKYDLKPGALWSYLKKNNVARTHTEARAASKKHGRLKQPKQRPRACGACRKTFEPVNPRHRICMTCAPTSTWRKRFDKYGVSKVLWDRLLKKQRGHCALCPYPPTHVDHNHKTMAVRGLLCATCNQAMRVIDDNPRWGSQARRYVRRDTGIRANPKRHAMWERNRGRAYN